MIASLVTFLVLACTASASTCPVTLPLSPSIAGRSISMMRSCGPGRFKAFSSASVSDTEIRYKPFQEDFNHGNVNPGWVCPQLYIFRMEKWAPLLIQLPRLVIPEDVDRNSDYCQREQDRQKILSRPQGATRDQFIAGMKNTIEGITYLRDHECRAGTATPLPFLYTEEYLNAWLDAPVTYLLSVAYNFGLCLDLGV
eukprot:TRINITY_DN5779_c0_g1_i1.p1 TRINITY_DN5779_c0_g1~~TRINITY_DN5779_c0_g1_i1.p1  ORF type:complete len:197 (-),score=16.01 TRINITY_DN5779_c0_g1_i1:230-820(-)